MKKNFIKKRSICALLILIFLFNAVSCSVQTPQEEANGRIEITEEHVEYSEEYIERVTERFSDMLDKIPSGILTALSSMNKQEALHSFTDKIIPKLCELKVYEEELDEVLSSTEAFINNEKSESSPSLFSSLYESLLYTLGSKRAGILAYATVSEILSSKTAKALDRYNKHGYSWYLTEAERCQALKDDLLTIGEDRFSEIISSATFILSTLQSADTGKQSALALSDAELLFILEHQGELFLQKTADEDSWKVIGRLITELLPGIDFTDKVPLHILYALKQEAYFDSLMQTMPYFFKLYASLTQSLKDEEIFSLSNSRKENERAIYSALLSSEAELRELYDSLIAYGSIDSDRLRRAVEDCYNKNEIDEFLTSHSPLSYDSLTAELEKCVRGDEGAKSADELIVGTLYSLSPYLTFIFFG